MSDQPPKPDDAKPNEAPRKREPDRVLPSGREDGGMRQVNKDAQEMKKDQKEQDPSRE